jgi:hypothetical protein
MAAPEETVARSNAGNYELRLDVNGQTPPVLLAL